MNTVTEILANRSAAEKRILLLELLRELTQQSPQQKPISIQDDSGKLLGLYSPIGQNGQDELHAEGTPGFFREIERRRQGHQVVSAEEAIAYLQGGSAAK